MAAAYEQMVNQIRATIPAVTDDLVTQQLDWVVHDFMNYSNCWVAAVSFTTATGVKEYDLDTAALAGRVNRLLNVVDANSVPVDAYLAPTDDELDLDTVVLAYEAGSAYTLTANFALVPYMNEGLESAVPEWFWDKYGPKVYSGVVARLLALPAKPWTNPALAGGYTMDFVSGRSTATAEVLARYTFRRHGWSFPGGWK